MTRWIVFLSFAVSFLHGCADTGQDTVALPLYVAGTDVSDPIETAGGEVLAIERADLAFGPLYLCAGAQAGDNCDTARLEWLDSVVVDTTRAEPEQAGELVGVSGRVQSWMFDLGISSQLTQTEPVALEAARKIGGVSLLVEGRIEPDSAAFPFRAAVLLQQEADTELGVPVVRRSSSDPFSHEVTPGDAGLVIRFDPREWLRGIELGPIPEDATDVVVEPGSQPFRSIRNALASGERPAFEWLSMPEP